MPVRRRRDAPNWESVSVGIITVATILAAATAAGIFTVAPEFTGAGRLAGQKTLRLLVAFLATVSLAAYILALVSGLSTPFQKTGRARIARAKLAAIHVAAQALCAFYAAISTILAPIVEDLDVWE